MRAIAFHLNDGPGSPEFTREAHAFARMYGCEAVGFRPYACRTVEAELTKRDEARFELVAFFCHGFRTKLSTGHAVGWRKLMPSYRTVAQLADAIAMCAAKELRVALYACSTAGTPQGLDPSDHPAGDGGFADLLRDALAAHGIVGHVDAHTVAGHTDKLPLVRRFYMDHDAEDGDTTGRGGEWIVAQDDVLWSRWRAALQTDFRLVYPTLEVEQIRQSLERTPG